MKKGQDVRGDFSKAADGAENKQAQNAPAQNRLVSRKQMQELAKQLSQPRYQFDLTPKGLAARLIRTDKDKEIVRQIEDIRQRLESRRHQARNAFNRAHDGPNAGLER